MRERVLQHVIKRGRHYARTTYVGLDGKRHALWRAGKNKTDAKKNLQKALDELKNDDGAITHAKKTFRELAEWYTKQYLIAPEYRDGRVVKGRRSYKSQVYLLRAITEYFGGYKLRSITHGELEKFKEYRLSTPTRSGPRTIASVNRELMTIRSMLRKAQKEGWLLRSPFEEHDPLIRMSDERRRERTLSYDEERRLLDAGGPEHLRPILVCALSTGMRFGEILKLSWDDVDINGQQIRVISTNTKTLTERIVPITPTLETELLKLKAVSLPEAQTVFGIKTNIKKSFRSACRKAGIKHGGIDGLTFHCLRHTAGTRMVKQGMELAEVARVLGHSDVKTTYRYISADSDIMDKARAALAFRPLFSQTAD